VATLNQGVIATEDTRRLQLASDEDLDGRRAEFSLKNLKLAVRGYGNGRGDYRWAEETGTNS